MEDYYDSYYNDFNNTIKWLSIIFIAFIIIVGVLCYIGYSESSSACEKFGGKLSGSLNCVRNGVSYEIEQKGIFTFKKQVVRKAVDINDALSEESE
jgi:hypothetical protein